MGERLNTRRMPVRTKIFIIVISFWVIPLLIIGGYSIFFYSNSINSRINDYLQSQFRYFNEFSIEKMNTAISASKNATYDMVIEQAYSSYTSGNQSYDSFFNIVDGYLREKYFLNRRYKMSAFFPSNNTNLLNINSRLGTQTMDYYKEKIHAKAIELSSSLGTNVDFIVEDNNVYIVRNMMFVLGPKNSFGILVLQVDPDYLFGHMFVEQDVPKSIAIALNQSTLRFDRDHDENINTEGDQLVSTLLHTEDARINMNRENIYFFNRKNTDDYSIGLGIIMDKNTVYSKYRNLIHVVYFIALLTVPSAIFVLYFLHTNVSRPIMRLVDATKQIRDGDFDVSLSTDAMENHEFKVVAGSFNKMALELKRLFEYVYKEELALKDAKILALQAQINPHFLGNTLELMNWQARMAGNVEVSNMIEALSVLLDSSMDRSDKRMVPLSEEIFCIDAYLYIISKRFGKRISYDKDIDDTLLTNMVPRLILQPLVENAVIHGIEPVQSGTITIKICYLDHHLIIRIMNDGRKMEDHELSRINNILRNPNGKMKEGSLGLRNVNERIKLIYGEEYALLLDRDNQGRTITEIKIPLRNLDQR